VAPVVPSPVTSQAAAQAAEKAAAKAAKKQEKKETKKQAKAALKEMPKEVKPFSTAGAFWYLLLAAIPVVGFIALLIFAFGGKNQNRKAMSRAILLWILIGLIITIAVSVAALLLFPELIEDIADAGSLEEITDIVLDELAARFD
jgi:cytochrome bd-type quinol oxidase subunit 2